MSDVLENFDGGLGISNLGILFKVYGKERKSKECGQIYEKFLKDNYPQEFEDFLEFRRKVEEKTHNIKELIFEWMDGKREIPNFELFDVYEK